LADAKAKASELELEMPRIEDITTNLELLETCYLLWEMSEFKHIPDPYEVMRLPSKYIDDLFRWHKGLRFTEDYPKRPPDMR